MIWNKHLEHDGGNIINIHCIIMRVPEWVQEKKFSTTEFRHKDVGLLPMLGIQRNLRIKVTKYKKFWLMKDWWLKWTSISQCYWLTKNDWKLITIMKFVNSFTKSKVEIPTWRMCQTPNPHFFRIFDFSAPKSLFRVISIMKICYKRCVMNLTSYTS